MLDSAGGVNVPAPVPSDPSLRGIEVFAQGIFLDGNGSCFLDLSVTEGLRLVLNQ